MDTSDFLACLRAEIGLFRACLDGDMGAPVERCDDWTLRDLTEHLAGNNFFVAQAVTEKINGNNPPAPEDPDALVPWFDESVVALFDALDRDPSTEAWTMLPPNDVSFWRRRWCTEVLIHRWDAEHALGRYQPMDPELAGEAVAETFEVMAPWLVLRGQRPEPAVGFTMIATDTGARWTYGPEPVAEFRGRAEDLALLVWGRLGFEEGVSTGVVLTSGDVDKARIVMKGMTP